MDIRQDFTFRHLKDPAARILELGPLNRPVVDKERFPNSRYCDIRSTEEVKKLYSGNEYLEATGIWVDTETIVDIDDVICGNYSQTYAAEEKFDAVIASHVLEHMDDLIFSLRDIGGILKPGGVFIIVYPDKRYCFDHFRQSASIRDAYTVFTQGPGANVPMVLDFYLNAVRENNPYVFWSGGDTTQYLCSGNEETALSLYRQACSGERMDDVHYWPFSDRDFLVFLRDCARLQLLPFRCIDFMPTQENDQQFFLALEYDPIFTECPRLAVESFDRWIPAALPPVYSSVQRRDRETVVQQSQQLEECRDALKSMGTQLNESVGRIESLLTLSEEKDALLREKDGILEEKERLIRQKDGIIEEKERLLQAENSLLTEKGILLQEREQMLAECRNLVTEMDGCITQKNALLEEKDVHLARQLQEIERLRQRELQQEESLRCCHVRITQLEEIENSRYWRAGRFLRRFLDALKHLFRGGRHHV